jgi:hypothetical protein
VTQHVESVFQKALSQDTKNGFQPHEDNIMTTTAKVTHVIASLHLPSQVPALISLAKGIVTAMTSNATFPTPQPTLAALTAAINDLETAEAATQARTRGAAATRNTKKGVLLNLLEQMRGYVQAIANASLDSSAAIIQSAGIGLKKVPVRPKRVFAASPGAVSGTVKLITESAAPRASYEWQSSVDGGKTWVSLAATLQAKTTVLGLTPGAAVSFRYRAVTKTGEGDWAQAIQVIVK